METLTALDRCDRCPGQAYVRWAKEAADVAGRTLGKTLDLILCRHHSLKYGDSLTLDGWNVREDSTASLLIPSQSVAETI